MSYPPPPSPTNMEPVTLWKYTCVREFINLSCNLTTETLQCSWEFNIYSKNYTKSKSYHIVYILEDKVRYKIWTPQQVLFLFKYFFPILGNNYIKCNSQEIKLQTNESWIHHWTTVIIQHTMRMYNSNFAWSGPVYVFSNSNVGLTTL